jgi:four helix bundle protein
MGQLGRLSVWNKSVSLAAAVYRAADRFPPSESGGLTLQARRAAASIPANIAEGSERFGGRDQARCYRIALGSARELESHLVLARELGFVPEPDMNQLRQMLDEVERMLAGLIRSCKARDCRGGNSKLPTPN